MDYSLDYTLPIEERVKLTEKITQTNNPLSKYDLTKLANYIIDGLPKNKEILTDNRLVTINKRETSYQGIAEKLECGEDGIYQLVSNLGKAERLVPKIEITDEDLEEIPGLKELQEMIKETDEQCKAASGKRKFLLKKQLIEMRQQQYILKEGYRKPSRNKVYSVVGMTKIDLDEEIKMCDGEPVSSGIVSLFNEEHVRMILKDYIKLKGDVKGKFNSDFWYLMLELDSLIEELKKEEPFLWDIFNLKVIGMENQEIKDWLMNKWGRTHSVEYISSLWKKKIPKWLVEKEKERYILWYYTSVEKGVWKRCSRCGTWKLAHNRWFSKNKTSKDGFYSICKECRNSKAASK